MDPCDATMMVTTISSLTPEDDGAALWKQHIQYARVVAARSAVLAWLQVEFVLMEAKL